MALITDPDLLADSATDDNSTEVYIDTASQYIKLVTTGDLSTDGVTLKCLYSFLKEEWRNDPNTKNLAAFPFPMVPITDESFEFIDGWTLKDSTARNLIRTAGWTVRNTAGNVTEKWAGIVGLGTIESDDQLYYQQEVAGATTNVVLTGQINQAVQILDDPNGDGSYVDGFDYRTVFNLFVREYNQVYGKATLSDIGVSTMDSIAYRFPIATTAELNIVDNDTNVGSNSPFTEIVTRWFDSAYSRDVDTTGTPRDFGIVVDVGTHSGIDGSMTSSGSTLTSATGGIPTDATYTGGTLIVHEGTNAGTYTISGTPTATVVTITGTFSATESNSSFTIQRASPVTATKQQIYTKVQYLLRQNSDIDASGTGTVTGKVADEILSFVGSTLIAGTASATTPANPNSGGTGVVIEGFQASDTNSIQFYDNTGTQRTFPFVAVLTLQFGTNLENDASAKYWVYFDTLPGAGDDYGESGALLVDKNDGTDMTGDVSAATSVQLDFDYDNNTQGGRTQGTDAAVVAVGIGLGTGQYVRASGTIEQSTTNSIALVAPLERNYENA